LAEFSTEDRFGRCSVEAPRPFSCRAGHFAPLRPAGNVRALRQRRQVSRKDARRRGSVAAGGRAGRHPCPSLKLADWPLHPLPARLLSRAVSEGFVCKGRLLAYQSGTRFGRIKVKTGQWNAATARRSLISQRGTGPSYAQLQFIPSVW